MGKDLENDMMLRWGLLLLWGQLLVGCATTRLVRLDTGDGAPIVHTPRLDAPRVELDKGEFAEGVVALARDVRPSSHPLQDARRLWGIPPRSGSYLYEVENRRVISLQDGEDATRGLRLLEPSSASDELTLAYGRWCGRKSKPGDCLHLLNEGPLLGSDGKYVLAMAIAMDSVWDETVEALKGMADPQAVLATVTSAMTMYMMMWVMPEPVSKGLAALITATAIAYLGVDTVWRIVDGWVHLVRDVDRAVTFNALREAGEKYGKVLGANAARVFVMLVTAAIGNTTGLAAKVQGLPGSAQAALAAETEAGFTYSAVEGVQSVAMSAEGFTIVLAPHVLAMSARGTRDGSHVDKHHLATIANEKSTARGGPWTPKFRELFKRAGMELEDPENIVSVEGHRGPHPERYHRIIFGEIEGSMRGCRSIVQCRATLEAVLRRLAREAATPGTELNLLLTQGTPP